MSANSLSLNPRQNQITVMDPPPLEKNTDGKASIGDTNTQKTEVIENNESKKVKFYPWNSTHRYGRYCGNAICFPVTVPDIKAGYKFGKTELKSPGQEESSDHLTQSLELSLGTIITPYASLSAFYQMDALKGDGVEVEGGKVHNNRINIHTVGARGEATLPLHFFGLTAFGKIGKSYLFAERNGFVRQIALPGEGLLSFPEHRAIQSLKWSIGASVSLTELVIDPEGLDIMNLFSAGYEYGRLHFKESPSARASSGLIEKVPMRGDAHQFMVNLNLRVLFIHIFKMDNWWPA